MLFACLSFTPSLLPRGGVMQGLVCGITAAIGYGARRARGLDLARVRRPGRAAAQAAARGGSSPSVAARCSSPRSRWASTGSTRSATLMGVTEDNLRAGRRRRRSPRSSSSRWSPRAWPPAVYRWVARLLEPLDRAARGRAPSAGCSSPRRHLARQRRPARRARDRRGRGVLGAQRRSRGGRRQQPTDRHCAPAARVAGRLGHRSAGEGRTLHRHRDRPRREIAAFTGRPALEPIRAYAGLDSADDAEDRAPLAVDDLERAGGFDRGTWSSPRPPAAAGSTRRRSTRSST